MLMIVDVPASVCNCYLVLLIRTAERDGSYEHHHLPDGSCQPELRQPSGHQPGTIFSWTCAQVCISFVTVAVGALEVSQHHTFMMPFRIVIICASGKD